MSRQGRRAAHGDVPTGLPKVLGGLLVAGGGFFFFSFLAHYILFRAY